nr:hypothetical protein [Mesorhizobium sp.]
MIWNEEIVFIHVPKTAGMSLTTMLVGGLKGRVFMTGHDKHERRGNVTLLMGGRHETMAQAQIVLEMHNRPLSSFQKVIAVMREPYTLEISRYNYLRIGHPWDAGPAQKIAMSTDFKGYLLAAPFFGYKPPRLDAFYHAFGAIPANAVFLKFEHLSEDIRAHIFPHLIEPAELPRENLPGRVVSRSITMRRQKSFATTGTAGFSTRAFIGGVCFRAKVVSYAPNTSPLHQQRPARKQSATPRYAPDRTIA